jgi:hypothetical protein
MSLSSYLARVPTEEHIMARTARYSRHLDLVEPRRRPAKWPVFLLVLTLFVLFAAIVMNLIGDGPLPPGYVSLRNFNIAGQPDDTKMLQHAISASAAAKQTLQIPLRNQPYRTGPLQLPSNTRIVMDPGVVIEAIPGFREGQSLVSIEDSQNAEILGNGAVLRMLKKEYTDGEQRHCIAIRGGSDIHIAGLSCNDSGGDGVYIGGGNRPYSTNVVLEDLTLDNNRRQGISIVSGSGIWIRRASCTNTNGTEPQSGIDLEPNRASNRLENIHIEDSITSGNQGDGIAFSLSRLQASSAEVSIMVTHHRSVGNGRSGFLAVNEQPGQTGARGTITVDGSASEGDGLYGAVASFYSASGPALIFQNLKVVDANRTKKTYDNAAIAIKRGGGGVGPQGNVFFYSTTILDNKHQLDHYFSLRDYSKGGYAKIKIVEPGEWRGVPPSMSAGLIDDKSVSAVNIP